MPDERAGCSSDQEGDPTNREPIRGRQADSIMIARLDNTSRSALIRGGIFAVALCAAVLLLSTVALAADGWFNPTKLYSLGYDSPDGQPIFDQSAWTELTPSYRVVADYFAYE